MSWCERHACPEMACGCADVPTVRKTATKKCDRCEQLERVAKEMAEALRYVQGYIECKHADGKKAAISITNALARYEEVKGND